MAEDISELIQAPTSAPVAAPTSAAPAIDPETYRSTLEHLINTGASMDQVVAYIRTAGIDPSQVSGLDDAIAAVAHGSKVRIPVALSGAPVVQHQQAAAPAHDDFSDFPEDFSDFPKSADDRGISGRARLHAMRTFPTSWKSRTTGKTSLGSGCAA